MRRRLRSERARADSRPRPAVSPLSSSQNLWILPRDELPAPRSSTRSRRRTGRPGPTAIAQVLLRRMGRDVTDSGVLAYSPLEAGWTAFSRRDTGGNDKSSDHDSGSRREFLLSRRQSKLRQLAWPSARLGFRRRRNCGRRRPRVEPALAHCRQSRAAALSTAMRRDDAHVHEGHEPWPADGRSSGLR
jgi:hypothetical protein